MFKIYAPEDLPKTLPLYPAAGMMVLPRIQFPLSMEDPASIAMVDDVLKSDRMIGIIQPKKMDAGTPPLYATGTAGRITAFEELEEGKYVIGITGVCRFHLVQEVPTARDYRMGEVKWDAYLHDLKLPEPYHFQRRALIDQLQDYFNAAGITVDWDAISRTPDALLINSLSLICPFDVPEKQALLEAPTLEKRLQTLQAILAFANAPSAKAQRVIN
ncbi:MAG TPA: LON peptidase substrate-binding domain-containing protein [Alphaproteobacteria bacterium]|nr:LON peptidase substrate-binding domain-containing protein [Alphaproteobacteria bacterium]